MTKYQQILRQGLLELPHLLKDISRWSSKLVDYETPVVERIWTEYKNCRLALHKIHPCSTPLKHVHPWPAAVKVLSGKYEMEMGLVHPGEYGQWDYSLIGSFIMGTGSEYDLLAKGAWHSVNPIDTHSISLMVMGKPWEPHPSMLEQPKPGTLKELTVEQIQSIIDEIR